MTGTTAQLFAHFRQRFLDGVPGDASGQHQALDFEAAFAEICDALQG